MRDAALLAVVILAFYVWIYPARGFRLAVGSDTPVYLWWARRTAVLGFRAALAGPRPGTVGPLAALAGALHERVATVIAALQPALAVAIGLGAAALADLCLGRDRTRFALVALFTAAFLSLLVPGYLSTLSFAAAFLAGLACVARAVRGVGAAPDGGRSRSGWGTVAAAGLLLGAAGLAHPLFLGLGAAILAGGLLALVLEGRVGAARRPPRRRIPRALSPGALRVTAAAVIGAVITVAGGAYVGPAARHAVQTSRDSILRTVGLGSLSRSSYVRVLIRFFPWYRIATVVGLALLAVLAFHRARRAELAPRSPGARLYLGAMVAWVAVTIGGIVALFAGTSAPAQRLAAFCLALPAFAAIGLLAATRRLGPSRRSRILLVAGAVLYLAVAQMFWSRSQPLIASTTSLQFRAAGGALAAQPLGTPIVLIVDDRSARPAFSVARNLNYLRDSVPADRVQDVQIFLGSPAGLIRGTPSITGSPEHDRVARWFWGQLRPALDGARTPFAVVVQAIDPESYSAVFHLPRVQRNPVAFHIAPGVMTIPRYHGTAPKRLAAEAATAYPSDSGTARFGPWTPVWLAFLLVLILALAGWPWARLSLPGLDAVVHVALSPAFGFAGIALAAMAVDAAGVRLAAGGGLLTVLVVVLGGFGALAASRALRARAAAARPATP